MSTRAHNTSWCLLSGRIGGGCCRMSPLPPSPSFTHRQLSLPKDQHVVHLVCLLEAARGGSARERAGVARPVRDNELESASCAFHLCSAARLAASELSVCRRLAPPRLCAAPRTPACTTRTMRHTRPRHPPPRPFCALADAVLAQVRFLARRCLHNIDAGNSCSPYFNVPHIIQFQIPVIALLHVPRSS